jgi:hypothetical protein
MMKTKLTLPAIGGLCLTGFLLLAGCRTSKTLTDGTSGATNLLQTEEVFFHTLRQRAFHYQTLSARVQFELVMPEGKTFSSRANLKIRKNDRMQFSIQPLFGIEAFRIELSPDSVLFVDRLNKRYLSEAFADIKGNTPVDFNFYNLQALFTNQLFLPGETELPENAFSRFRWKQTASGFTLQTQDQTEWQYSFMADREEKLFASEITDLSSQQTLHWDYADFRPVGTQLFPMKISAGWFVEDKSKGALSVNYSRIDPDVAVEINSAAPSGYERVNFSQILKMFEKP